MPFLVSTVTEPRIQTRQYLGSAVLHQLTSTQTVQAFIVHILVLLMAWLVGTGQEIPDLVGSFIGVVIGYYFAKADGGIVVDSSRVQAGLPEYDPLDPVTREVDMGPARAEYARFQAGGSVADDDPRGGSSDETQPPQG